MVVKPLEHPAHIVVSYNSTLAIGGSVAIPPCVTMGGIIINYWLVWLSEQDCCAESAKGGKHVLLRIRAYSAESAEEGARKASRM